MADAEALDTAGAGLLGGLRALADVNSELATRDAASAGAPVSCRKGCSACCRQVAPLLPIELPALVRVIGAMTADERAALSARAFAARARAEAAGIGGLLDAAAEATTTAASRRRLAVAWFDLGIDCPFLVDDACSIHEERPLSCREFLVTSDPASCANPSADVHRVVLRGSASEAAKQALRAAGVEAPRRVLPMVDAILLALASVPPQPV